MENIFLNIKPRPYLKVTSHLKRWLSRSGCLRFFFGFNFSFCSKLVLPIPIFFYIIFSLFTGTPAWLLLVTAQAEPSSTQAGWSSSGAPLTTGRAGRGREGRGWDVPLSWGFLPLWGPKKVPDCCFHGAVCSPSSAGGWGKDAGSGEYSHSSSTDCCPSTSLKILGPLLKKDNRKNSLHLVKNALIHLDQLTCFLFLTEGGFFVPETRNW